MYEFEQHAFSRASASLFIASINHNHIHFIESQSNIEIQAYVELKQKTDAFLSGQLKSLENLERFQQQAFQWRNELEEQDMLAFRIFDFCFNALSHGVDCLLDTDINEFPLLFRQLDEINLEMQELGMDIDALKNYQSELFKELDEILLKTINPPITQHYFSLIQQTDTSLFGMQN